MFTVREHGKSASILEDKVLWKALFCYPEFVTLACTTNHTRFVTGGVH